MEEPIAPRYEDFELTAAAYSLAPTPPLARLAEKAVRYSRKFLLVAIAMGALYGVARVHEAARVHESGILPMLGSAFVWGIGTAMAGGILAMALIIAGSLLLAAERRVFSIVSPQYRNAREYDQAVVRYRSARAEYDRWLAKRREDYWRSLTGIQFENELAALYRKMGYEARTTRHTADGGVDIIVKEGDETLVVQCKAHQSKVSIRTARELAQSMRDFGAARGVIACIAGVTGPTADYIKDKKLKIEVLDVHAIVELQIRHG